MITTKEAKKLIIDALNRMQLPYNKVTAKNIDFSDLARGNAIFVTIHGWNPSPKFKELEKIAHENNFIVDAS